MISILFTREQPYYFTTYLPAIYCIIILLLLYCEFYQSFSCIFPKSNTLSFNIFCWFFFLIFATVYILPVCCNWEKLLTMCTLLRTRHYYSFSFLRKRNAKILLWYRWQFLYRLYIFMHIMPRLVTHLFCTACMT